MEGYRRWREEAQAPATSPLPAFPPTRPRVEWYTPMSLNYEPASEPPHISVKKLFLGSPILGPDFKYRFFQTRTSRAGPLGSCSRCVCLGKELWVPTHLGQDLRVPV